MCASRRERLASAPRPRATATSTSLDHRGLRDHRGGCGPSRLRLPFRECPLRRGAGPPPDRFHRPQGGHIRIMGDKIEGEAHGAEARHPVFPGSEGGVETGEEAKRVARRSATRAGEGCLRRWRSRHEGRPHRAELDQAIGMARSEAKAAFGDDSVYLEKYLEKPRHIEVQVLGDGNGGAVHLAERDCSLQRRHQKVWEEGGSPALNEAMRAEIGGICANAMKQLGYLGAGTVEFLYEDGRFYFIEMNTRIQVEHPVTEMITGIDLVNEQIRVAARRSPFDDAGRHQGRGPRHRVPHQRRRTRRPSGPRRGRSPITTRRRPRSPRRFGCLPGLPIPPNYDSLIGKLIVHGPHPQ
ncbi:hypothetical protein Lal_00046437 [Lupinus albus]|nr:hypothetical protein Lal_00046437 [Lupinus albus]